MLDPLGDVIKYEEGFSEIAYPDMDRHAFGYGFNYITREEADWILDGRVDAIWEDMMATFGARFMVYETARQAALISMRYQLGQAGFLGFKKMISAVKREDWEEAADECLDSRAAFQTPERFHRNSHALRTGESPWEVLS